MIDPHIIRNNPDYVRSCLQKRGYPVSYLDDYIELDAKWRQSLKEMEDLKSERKKATPKGKPTSEQLVILKELADKIKLSEDTVTSLESELNQVAYQIPNIIAEDVPDGKTEEDNEEIRKVGSVPVFNFKPRSHDELGEALNIMDFSRATKVTGSRFVIHKGLGAKLERAIMNFMVDLHTSEHGYYEVWPPSMVNTKSLYGTGQLPKFEEDQFKLADTDYWLSPTAEVQLTNFYQNEILKEEELPQKLTAFTSCFRKEAGSYGKDQKGIIRNHQFDKVELVKFVHPEKSFEELESLTSNAEEVLKRLGLAYRLVKLCSGDLGFCSAKTYDIEVWFPSQNKYREISSCSNFLDFQARRAMIRYRSKDNSVSYLHTLNGSGLAVGRTLAAILENYQNEDGSVTVPDALKPYMGLEVISWAKETKNL